jgi:hypothetical protein
MGAATMFFFGLGTIPLMLAVGGGISLMSLRFRQRMLTLAAWCVIVTGVISVARGIYAVPWEASSETSTTTGNLACPFCSDHEG